MEQTATEVFSKVRSAVEDVRTGLVRFERMLDSFESGEEQVSRGYLDLIGTLLLGGSVDVWYHGEYIAVPFQRLPEWFSNPTAIAAGHYRINEATLRRWLDSEFDGGVGTISLPCNHRNCRQTRTLTFYDPREMQVVESKATSGIWYCHHHRTSAWQSEEALGDEHLGILQRVHSTPGCTRQHLRAKKGDTDFLISIGLLSEKLPGNCGNGRALAFRLTDEGQRIVAERSEQ
ncbi:hypothetical protein [Burkholderia contaminans]|uniref:Uncharacterized protein n=1 Tax=Burkholderia contaminans TaxID=488447 RepID=A0AAP4VKG3_9BURK|nr:hypothetical protein [Burkholderia contaminans]MDN7570883.1 hypothetical protein [Burkholderia contaminans]